MVDFFKESDRVNVIDLWQRTFGDDRTYISNYIDTFAENIIVYRIDDVAVGMVSLLDVCTSECKGGYIYALAVDKKHRKQGIATRLLSYAQEIMSDRGYDFLLVVPEPYDSLEKFYKKLGFAFELPLCKLEIQAQDVAEEVAVACVGKDEYYRFRRTQPNTIFHSKRFFEYVYEDLNLDGFQFLRVQSDMFVGYCICVIRDDCAIIKEVLPIKCDNDIAHCVCKALNVEKAIFISNNGGQKCPFALLKYFGSEFNDNLYANLLLDSFGG